MLAEYRSLRVSEMTELRRKARSSGVYLRVQRPSEAATPLEKLYRRWLENTYARASASFPSSGWVSIRHSVAR